MALRTRRGPTDTHAAGGPIGSPGDASGASTERVTSAVASRRRCTHIIVSIGVALLLPLLFTHGGGVARSHMLFRQALGDRYFVAFSHVQQLQLFLRSVSNSPEHATSVKSTSAETRWQRGLDASACAPLRPPRLLMHLKVRDSLPERFDSGSLHYPPVKKGAQGRVLDSL